MQKRNMTFLLGAESIVLIIVLVICLVHPATKVKKQDSGRQIVEENMVPTTEKTDVGNEIIKEEAYTETRETFSESVEAKLSEMSVEEKVAQLFLVTPEQLTGVGQVVQSGNTTKNAINEHPVAGFIYSTPNFYGMEQVQLMLSKVQEFSQERIGLPMYIAVAEEGGANNSPLASTVAYNITLSAKELGDVGDAQKVIEERNNRAEYLNAEGFNMILGPVADLTDEAATLGDRTYSSDASVVAEMIAADVATTQNAGIITAVEYFPFYSGNNDATLDELNNGCLLPYAKAIENGAKCITVAHSTAVAITGTAEIPCSMSEGTAALLRGKMGYKGVLMTDSLSDERITNSYSSGDAAVKAIQAGMDLLNNPADFNEAYTSVLNAVNDGTISSDRLDNAVGRILSNKI